ncbi:MAG: hypothetical protein ACO3UM_11465, partial [Planctomycetota bacterium]
MLASLIALALSQAAPGPSISPQAGDQALDRVRLVVGTELTGRIRVETADDTWWLATAPTPGGAESGAYFVGRRVERKVETATDRATVDRLW